MNDATRHYIAQHRTDDVRKLALQGCKDPAVEMQEALTQIAGWQQACRKLPRWAATEGVEYPPHLALEQCSSEITADYKAELVGQLPPHQHLTDLTGGLGIDCSTLATRFARATYVERQELLCRLATHNFPLLGVPHITVCQADGVEYLKQMAPCDWIYLDPARRSSHGGKVVALTDCEPDVTRMESLLVEKGTHVLVKLSPMLDLTQALHTLKHVRAAHIVAVDHECKELLLQLGQGSPLPPDEVPVHCIHLSHRHPMQQLVFCRKEEQEAVPRYAAEIKSYLYEPHAALLKGGAYQLLTHRYAVEKLHPNSHLYTSDTYVADFPGRRFRVACWDGFGKQALKSVLTDERRGNLTVRNFPLTADALRKKLRLADGGDSYYFATTLLRGDKVLVRCHAV